MPQFGKYKKASFWESYKADFFFLLAIFVLPAFFSSAFADQIIYESGGRRDPFGPLVGPNGILNRQSQNSNLHVEGIIFDPAKGSLVLVNGEFYKEGDAIGAASVVSISKDRVIFRQDEEDKTVWLTEDTAQEGEKKDETTVDASTAKA